jgi:hypothetical protein
MEAIAQVTEFALGGEPDRDLKASMRRLSTYKSDTYNQSIKYIVTQINTPQVREYWDPNFNQAEPS